DTGIAGKPGFPYNARPAASGLRGRLRSSPLTLGIPFVEMVGGDAFALPLIVSAFHFLKRIMSFETLGLPEALTRAVRDAGYESATDVQARAIPPAIEGRDLMVSSSTGSGKTASFVLPALTRVLAARGDNSKRREKGVVHGPRILVLTPTRELA